MEPIRFTLNGRAVAVQGVSPTRTALEWLREEAGLSGTKEGCAEGDCGACTIAIADPVGSDGKPVWRSINSCLALLPMLHGRQVRTVEGIAEKGNLHPAQAAMVDTLGSQCGYCTPGVVMSMFEGCYRRDLTPGAMDARLDDQMCGNLCRCTGYRPIREAAARVAGLCPDDALRAEMDAASPARSLAYEASDQKYFAPASLEDLFLRLKEHPDARIVAGATDLGIDVTKRYKAFSCLISVEAIEELSRITPISDGARVGAGVRLADLEAVARRWPPLARGLRYFASRQIKNRATLGGNLCNASPIGDTAPVLIALGARAVLASRAGERVIPLESFFLSYRKTALQPGEILTAVEIPDLSADVLASAYKVSKRREMDISAVAAGVWVRVRDGRVLEARIGFAGMAATPSRARHAEQALVGQEWSEATVELAAKELQNDFTPIGDHRGSAWYRLTVAQNFLRGFFHETCQEAQPILDDRHTGTIELAQVTR